MRESRLANPGTLSVWLAAGVTIGASLALAAASPLLAWRDAIYIGAGFAGVIALGLLLVQLLLGTGVGAGVAPRRMQRAHRWVGLTLVLMVLAHVGGLWVTSPPDVIDALTFSSPTPFSVWGVAAMWAAFGAAALGAFRRRVRLRLTTWRAVHGALALILSVGAVVHAVLIEGAMEATSKYMLCGFVLLAAAGLCRVWWRRLAKGG